MASQSHTRILTLDAGGVKCISSLLILQSLMCQVHPEISNLSERTQLEPCNYFHMICGSEWGGVLAIMLGRLRMGVQDCLDWLNEVSYAQPGFLGQLVPFSRATRSRHFALRFEALVNKRFEQHPELGQNRLLLDPDNPRPTCKTLILAFDINAPQDITRFQSYGTSSDRARWAQHQIPIWEVALAAISSPHDMDPVHLSNGSFTGYYIDASIMGYSNASREAVDEGFKIWQYPWSVRYVFNLGCGPSAPSTAPNWLRSCVPTIAHLALTRFIYTVSTDSERVARQMNEHSLSSGYEFARFNVNTINLQRVNISDWTSDSRDVVGAATRSYLHTIDEQLKGWGRTLQDQGSLHESPLEGAAGSIFDSVDLTASRHESTENWLRQFKLHIPDLMGDAWPEEYPRIKLAILDTGIDATHDWLKLRLSEQSRRYADFTQDNFGYTSEEDPKDLVGHGTHVAGVILQLAPLVELYVARVFDAADFEGEASEKAFDRVAKAIDHAVKKWKVNIISMSFGFSFKSGRRHEKMHTAISNASDNNVVMFAAASNNGNRDEIPVAYPARDLRIICINASDGDGNKMFFNPPPDNEGNNFSVIGHAFPSIWPSAVPAKGTYDPENRPGLWKYSSGTSVATPVAAALAAVIMQFGLTHGIERQIKLQSYLGIRQVFKKMSGDRTADGFWDVRPWLLLDSKDLTTSRFKIRSCLDNL